MKNKKKKIAYVSGTRADFGLMTPILAAIKKSNQLDLKLYATGTHLMPAFGNTVNEVKKQFPGVTAIRVAIENDERSATAKFTGLFINKLVDIFKKNRPDFVLTLGDRPEMLCTALACLYLGIPTGQVHGGDKTTTVDEVARHAITKLSHLHFPATKEAAERIRKMGEESWRIKVVGAPALDTILNEKLPSRAELFSYLKLNPKEKVILLTQHPVSEEMDDAAKHVKESIEAVKKIKLPTVITYPNADAGGRKIIEAIEKEKNNPLFRIYPSLEYKYFLALEREAAVWIGNSSGAMIESSSFKTPVVNVGRRQSGRQHAENVLNVGYNRNQIKSAIRKSLEDKNYLKRLQRVKNPWGDGKTGPRVAKILEQIKFTPKLISKRINY